MNLLRRPSSCGSASAVQSQSQERSMSLLQISTGAALLGLAMSLVPFQPVDAANNISLEYGPIQRTLPYSELESFTTTKKPTGLIADLITFAKQEPDKVYTLLTTTIPIKVTTMDRIVNSYIGEIVLSQLGQVILPISGGDPVKALRAGFVGGVKNDQISVMSFIQSYPVDMRVNGERLLAIRKQIDQDSQYLPEIIAGLQGVLSKFMPGFSFGPVTGTTAPGATPTPSPSASPSPSVSPTPTATPTP